MGFYHEERRCLIKAGDKSTRRRRSWRWRYRPTPRPACLPPHPPCCWRLYHPHSSSFYSSLSFSSSSSGTSSDRPQVLVPRSPFLVITLAKGSPTQNITYWSLLNKDCTSTHISIVYAMTACCWFMMMTVVVMITLAKRSPTQCLLCCFTSWLLFVGDTSPAMFAFGGVGW